MSSIKKIWIILFLIIPLYIQAGDNMQSFYDFNATDITGKIKSMSEYKGKVVLVVNVASKCSFTPQYKGLEDIYKKYKKQGLEILAFPCNQFNKQEPGTKEQIKSFCDSTYSVTFPLFDKIDVNGENTHPLYKFLKKEATGFLWTESIKWNFTKFLIDREGNVITRYGSATKPKSIEADIVEILG